MSYGKLVGVLTLGAALLAHDRGHAQQFEEGRARVTPWSGYWWPHFEGRMITGPLRKYELATGRPETSVWEARQHPRNVPKWFGYCHAWSAASVMEREPTSAFAVTTPTGGQIILDIGDQKGLLTVAHARDVANVFGRRFHGRPGDDRNDLYPDVLWKYLKLYIRQQGIPLILDLDAGEQVWNYPCYAYRVDYAPAGGDVYNCRLTLWTADDTVPPSFIGTKVNKKTYSFTCRMRGGSVVAGSGRWVGASERDHPDFAWYPHVVRPENPHIDYALVRRMLGRPSTRDGDPPMPTDVIADPANPPQPANSTLRPPEPLPGMAGERPMGGPPPFVPSVVLSPNELLTLVIHQHRSPQFSFDITVDKFDGGRYVVGEPFFIQGTANKAGYLYLFRIDREGNMELLFPMQGQDNRIPAESRFVLGGPKDPAVRFVCSEPIGMHRIRALITTKPLSLSGITPVTRTEQGQSAPLQGNPTQEQFIRALIVDVQADKIKPQQVDELTGIKLKDLPFEFSMDEVGIYVGAAPGKPGEPGPTKPADKTPGASRPQ